MVVYNIYPYEMWCSKILIFICVLSTGRTLTYIVSFYQKFYLDLFIFLALTIVFCSFTELHVMVSAQLKFLTFVGAYVMSYVIASCTYLNYSLS